MRPVIKKVITKKCIWVSQVITLSEYTHIARSPIDFAVCNKYIYTPHLMDGPSKLNRVQGSLIELFVWALENDLIIVMY